MSTNTSSYGSTAKTTRMNIADLTVGQTLVRRSITGYYPHNAITYTNWTIIKILKNRLVIRREGQTDEAHAVRILVKNNKSWPSAVGEVETGYEGMNTWDRNAYYLFTEDDALLAEHRRDDEKTIQRQIAERKTRDAIELLTANLKSQDLTKLDAIDKAIALLNDHRTFILNNKESE